MQHKQWQHGCMGASFPRQIAGPWAPVRTQTIAWAGLNPLFLSSPLCCMPWSPSRFCPPWLLYSKAQHKHAKTNHVISVASSLALRHPWLQETSKSTANRSHNGNHRFGYCEECILIDCSSVAAEYQKMRWEPRCLCGSSDIDAESTKGADGIFPPLRWLIQYLAPCPKKNTLKNNNNMLLIWEIKSSSEAPKIAKI